MQILRVHHHLWSRDITMNWSCLTSLHYVLAMLASYDSQQRLSRHLRYAQKTSGSQAFRKLCALPWIPTRRSLFAEFCSMTIKPPGKVARCVGLCTTILRSAADCALAGRASLACLGH
eukprot:1352404-Pleurochrysis_carterae.AAC.2